MPELSPLLRELAEEALESGKTGPLCDALKEAGLPFIAARIEGDVANVSYLLRRWAGDTLAQREATAKDIHLLGIYPK